MLGTGLALLAVVLGLFAFALLRGQDSERDAADRRFGDQAKVTAALTESLFSSTADQTATQNRQRFGGDKVDVAELDKAVKRGRLTYAAVLDFRGNPIATSSGTDVAAIQRLQKVPAHVKEVLGGAKYRLSGYIDDKSLEYVAGFDSQSDGKRYLVQGFSAPLINAFLGGYLTSLPDAKAKRSYVVDTNDRIIAATSGDVAAGTVKKSFATGSRAATSAPVGGTDWAIVLTQAKSTLYKETGVTVEWLILIALAAAGVATIFLMRRTLRTTANLQSAYEQLEAANMDLERTNLELVRSNGELEQFASVASHDLQEPLRKVQQFGDQLERRFGDELPDEAKDYLRRMRRAANRMSTLIEDLLRFSRVTTHAKPPQRVDLARVARDVTQDLEALVQETHGRVEIGVLPTVEADPVQMRQLLQNLIGNGLKFHRPGAPPVVRLDRAPSPGRGLVAFTVSDNGIGFEDVYEERIFRVFERLHPRDVYAGTGIGLALCRKIAERHGGTITGHGVPDEGATFTIALPQGTAQLTNPATPVKEPAHV